MAQNQIDMTATEIGFLWSTYQAESLNHCLLTYFDHIVEDPEIKELNKRNWDSCKKNRAWLNELFEEDGFPVPESFNESDVNPSAARLYTDPFILYFQWFIGKGKLDVSSLAINTIARDDIFSFYENCVSQATQLLNDARKLLLSKGLWIRAPYIPMPQAVSYVKKESFLNGWIGEERPIAGIEIASIFYNLMTNSLGQALMTSFIQVSKKGEVHNKFVRGREIAAKHVDVLSAALKKENLSVPNTWNTGITASTEPPFSEKLMLNMVSFLNSQGLANYGTAVSLSMKRDIGLDFTRLAAEVANFTQDSTKLLIKKGWMETPPLAPKRE
ncbi:DUF3231 family protein [Cytobacillus spongiae]|uniref:DUF3231 family protein n=1 Tax=Cytobacillus spongiae TaxID=2901381 RepID=UPI001F2D4BF5|nr:DUF3231 family protein [Cytobacillus spongiae]UII57650.1 DUF3231 family protein [Cytobacillus spongiae]